MEKSINNEYSNIKGEVGMFGTGFMTFNGKSTAADAKKFISLLIEIKDLDDDDESKAEEIFGIDFTTSTFNKFEVFRNLKGVVDIVYEELIEKLM